MRWGKEGGEAVLSDHAGDAARTLLFWGEPGGVVEGVVLAVARGLMARRSRCNSVRPSPPSLPPPLGFLLPREDNDDVDDSSTLPPSSSSPLMSMSWLPFALLLSSSSQRTTAFSPSWLLFTAFGGRADDDEARCGGKPSARTEDGGGACV